MSAAEYEIGEAEPHDMNLVYSAWIRGFHVHCKDEMPSWVYWDWQQGRVDKILSRKALVLVARDVERPLFVYGYGVFERVADMFVAHWVYVKCGKAGDYRRAGIGSELLHEAIRRIGGGAEELVATHKTDFERKHGVPTRMGFRHAPLDSVYHQRPRQEEAAAQ